MVIKKLWFFNIVSTLYKKIENLWITSNKISPNSLNNKISNIQKLVFLFSMLKKIDTNYFDSN